MMPPANAGDALASLRAAADSRQLYNQALLGRLAAGQQQQQQLGLPQNMLGFSQSSQFHANPPTANNMLLAAAARNARSGATSVNPALLAAAAAGTNQSSTGTHTALTRHYLQLLQNRQDVASALTGAAPTSTPSTGAGDGDAASDEER